jgi:hypothetical protein
VICEDTCDRGYFAVETILFLPDKRIGHDSAKRFKHQLPRICCLECASEYVQDQKEKLSALTGARNIFTQWTDHMGTMRFHEHGSPENEMYQQDEEKCIGSVIPISEADQDPLQHGFLICTQLVKTGGADQGGLQVGDVFVGFGHYSKSRFPGLKSIANLVRKSAGKEIPVVIWRKLESVEDDGSSKTLFQKLALKLRPLQSHDADGGGVLGAVINTYPLPEMKN